MVSVGCLLGVLHGASAIGQDAPEPNQFGTASSWTVIPATRIVPVDVTTYQGDWAGGTYYRWSNGGGVGWFAADLDLPPGVEIEGVCLHVYDVDPNSQLTMQLMVSEMGDGGQNPVTTSLATATSGGTPGYTQMCAFPANPVVVRSWADSDSNGVPSSLTYWIKLTASTVANSNVRWGAARIGWHRKISPASGSQSFGDVPTNHVFYTHIEALKNAGVTTGCGNGNFCPDAPLTRGQMAVFLAKALGLHWQQ
jgi:hypothetical protein